MRSLRFTAFLFLSLLLHRAALATIYYVSPTGSDAAAGTSTASPWKTIAKVNAASLGSGDQVLFLRGGTWREMLTPHASGLSFGAYGTGARPIISGSNLVTTTWTNVGTNVWSSVVGGSDLTNVWFNTVIGTPVTSVAAIIGPGQWYWNGSVLYVYQTANPATAFTAPGVEITRRDEALVISNIGSITVEHLGFVNSHYINIYLGSGLTGTQTFNDVLWSGAKYEGFYAASGTPSIDNSLGLYNLTGLAVGGGTGFTLTNSLLSGNHLDAIEIYGTTGPSRIQSSTISGNSTDDSTGATIENWASYSLTASNSVLLGNPYSSLNWDFSGLTDDGTNVQKSPLFTARAAPLIIVPYIDDYNNLSVAESVAAAAATYGCHISYAINTKLVTPANWTRVSAMQTAGNEIVAHTRSHSDLANNNVFTILYKGTAPTAKMTIDTVGGTIQTFLNNSITPDLNIPLLDKYNSMQNVCSQINANTAYSCTDQTNQDFFTPFNLASVSLVNIKSAYTASAAPGYLTWEIEGAKADIAANVPGYIATTFATPFTSSNNTVENHIRDAGFLANRNGTITATGQPNGNWLFSNLDVFNMGSEWLPNGYNPSQPAGSVGALIEGLGAAGGVFGVYSHGFDEFTLAQWQQLFQINQQIGGTCMTMNQASAYVQTNGTLLPDGTNKNWTRTIPLTPNYTNTPSSPVQGAHGLLN
ncbi:MAG: hypothetical protein JWM43_3506 [Acidobacteriaceae bacterium]|nr:hypothetical protein [Acidobacteriaceae bacterium]